MTNSVSTNSNVDLIATPDTIALDVSLFAKTHPYYLLVNDKLQVRAVGSAIQQMLPALQQGTSMAECFCLLSPPMACSVENINTLLEQAVVLQLQTEPVLALGGAFYTYQNDGFIFLGYPQFHDLHDLQQSGVMLSSFARSDAIHFYITTLAVKNNALRELEDLTQSLEQHVSARTQDLQQANRELITAREAADAASQAKSLFLATVSHEIRTPMNGVLGMTELLLDTPLNTQQQRMAQTIYKSGESLLQIINDILDFSKIEAGKMELSPVDFDLPSLMMDVVNLYSARASGKGLLLEARVDANLPTALHGDALRIKQVLNNLVSNAIKFTERGRITVSVAGCADIRVAICGTERVCVTFAVTDTGMSFDNETRHRLFKPFSQADNSMARRFGGTGLGLAISRQLVELMGGHIEVENNQGSGSTFYFTVPLLRAVKTTHPKNSRSFMLSSLQGRVLLAEDNPVNAELALAMLQQFGLTVELAANGQEAYDKFCCMPFDLVLMDCQMPEMDGFEAVAQIRRYEQRHLLSPMPIIALTANAMSGDREHCLEAGMNGYLAKPFRRDELYQALLLWLQVH